MASRLLAIGYAQSNYGYTAIELFPIIPQALALPSPHQLEVTNKKLAQEIKERQQAEASLKQSEARFRSIFEGASIGIEIIDLKGQTVARNQALEQMLGYHTNNQSDFPAQVGSDRELVTRKRHCYELNKEYLYGERDYYQLEKRYLCKDGQLLWCHVTGYLVRDSESNPQFGIRMVENVTEHKQALKELQHYQERLEDLVVERTAFLAKVNEQLTWEATHDGLTRLINRREFEQRLADAVTSAKNQNQNHTLCFLDLDRFKIVNDTCGHAAGDELLRQVSTLLQIHVRHTDLLARLGGDEFGLLLYNCSLKQALQVSNSLLEAIRSFQFIWQDKTFTIGVSIGMVPLSTGQSYSLALLQSPEKVLNAADAACYQAKNRGRNRVHVYTPNDEEVSPEKEQGQWISKINQAIGETDAKKVAPISTTTPEITHNQFCLYYQPIVSLSAHQLIREYNEVLLRLLDEKGKIIPPMAFLPTAERYDLLPTIDRWVIRTFFTMLAQQEKETENHCLYAINLSTGIIKDEQFVDFIQEQFSIHQIRPSSICFEIAESVAIANLNKVTKLITALKALNCCVALDDFGSNMSSFNYIRQLPLDYLKITGDLVKKIADDVISLEMVKAINKISHIMGIKTIAKFVTNDAILENIAAMGVDYAQGYGIAAPRPLIVRLPLIYEDSLLERHYC